jgi:hypothetical protein
MMQVADGALRLARGRVAETWPRVPSAPLYVLTSKDGILARLPYAEASGLAAAEVGVLVGGTAAWRAAGLPLEAGPPPMADEAADDVYLRPYDRVPAEIPQAMRDYLQSETALLPQLERDGTLRFALLSAFVAAQWFIRNLGEAERRDLSSLARSLE